MTVLIVLLAIVLLCATAFFVMGTIRERSTAEGEAQLASKNYADAFEAFKKADKFSLRPDRRVINGLARSSIGLEDYDSARKYYELSVKLDPNDAESRHTLGLLCIRAKDYEAADKEISALRAINTQESLRYADNLEKEKQTGMVKGFFLDLFKKIAPGVPNIPGLTEEKPVSPETASEDNGI